MGQRGRILVALIAAAFVAAGASPAWANRIVEFEVPARDGEIDDRWYGYAGTPRARAILPDDYDRHRAYPVLYILAGLSNTYSWYTDPDKGNIGETVEGLDAIVVTPEGGTGGWYADWWNRGRRGDPAWESYFLDQVVPQIEARFKIRPERRYHALSGGSMGGLGAAYLGGRLPGYFGTVVISSGFVDPQLYPGTNWGQSLISGLGQTIDPELVYGPLRGFYANGHNPVKLASNLTQTRVFMSTGDGRPTDDDSGAASDQVLEIVFIKPMSDSYAVALRAANVDLTYEVHPGRHDWANHRRQLAAAIDWGLFEKVPERPRSWVNDTVAQHGRLWQFGYRFDSPPDRVVRFERKRNVLSVGAAGSPVTITTRRCRIHLETPGELRVPKRRCA